MEINGGASAKKKEVNLVFVYGTLKKGFGNHWLTEELLAGGHAEYIGPAKTKDKYPLVCGPFQVPFLLFMEGQGCHVAGELYGLDDHGLARFDELEGTTKGHYVRRGVRVLERGDREIEAQGYFAANSYAAQLWRKAGQRGLTNYSEEESRNYVRRKDRPSHMTFLQHIHLFLSAPPHDHRQPVNPRVR